MWKPWRLLAIVAVVTVTTCLQFTGYTNSAYSAPLASTVSTPGDGEPKPEEGPLDLVFEIARSYPERKTGSYGASRFLSYLAGNLQLLGWSTEVLPYTNITKTVSEQEKSVVYMRVTGENLLALESPDKKDLDYLIVSPYDNLFADIPEDIPTSSSTLVSTALALEVARKLERSELEFGLAFVSGHYQNSAGMWALLDVLENDGITIDAFLILGDLQASLRLPLIAGPKAPVSFVETVIAEAETRGLDPFLTGDRTLRQNTKPALVAGRLSPEAPLGRSLRVENELPVVLDRPVLTVGALYGDPTAKLSPASTPVASLGRKMSLAAEAIASALGTPLPKEGPLAGDTPYLVLLGESRYVPRNIVLALGLCTAALLAAVAIARIPRDPSSLLLPVGTCAASALSMVLHALFSNRASHRYASDVLPGRSLLLVFIIFSLTVLAAFLRLWNVRSRIHYIHERSGIGKDPSGDKKVWGSAWSLAILAALMAGAAYTQSEMLPPLMIAGVCHGLATLLLKQPPEGQDPPAYKLWPARILYLAPLLGVFWAGNPFDPPLQAVYRASWTGLNRGSMVSALSLGVAAASIFSTVRMPRPFARKSFVPLSLLEVLGLALILVTGFLLPTSYGPEIRSWAVAEETYDHESSVVFSAPVPIREVSLVNDVSQESGEHTSLSGFKSLPLQDTVKSDWASPVRTHVARDGETGAATGSNLREMVADFRLKRYADAVSIETSETLAPRSILQGFEVQGLHTLLGCSPEDLKGETTLELPPGYSITVIWWNTVDLQGPLKYAVKSAAWTRLTQKLQALYFDTSYTGITPVTEGIRYYRLTSSVRRYTGQ